MPAVRVMSVWLHPLLALWAVLSTRFMVRSEVCRIIAHWSVCFTSSGPPEPKPKPLNFCFVWSLVLCTFWIMNSLKSCERDAEADANADVDVRWSVWRQNNRWRPEGVESWGGRLCGRKTDCYSFDYDGCGWAAMPFGSPWKRKMSQIVLAKKKMY